MLSGFASEPRPETAAPAGHRSYGMGWMHLHRGYLFWGIFFILLGGLPLADRLGWIDIQQFGDVGRYWPVILIAIGLAVLVSRSQLALLGTVAAALVLGGLAGGALAYGSGWIFDFGDCAPGDRGTLERTSRSGTFAGDAAVELELRCGTVDVGTAAGDGWVLDARYREDPPRVEVDTDRLTVRAPEDGPRRQEWALTVPSTALRDLDVRADAATATLDLGGAQLDRLDVEANAADVRLGGAGAAFDDLRVAINAGAARVTLDGPAQGSLSVNAGSIDLCVPPDAELRLEVRDQLTFSTNLEQRDLVRDGDTWTRTGSGPTISLRVEGNAASFSLDPSGGCR